MRRSALWRTSSALWRKYYALWRKSIAVDKIQYSSPMQKSATQCISSNATLSLIDSKCCRNRRTQKRKLPNGRVTKNNVQWRKYCPLDKILFSGGNTVQQSSTSGQMEEQLLRVPLSRSNQSLKTFQNLFLSSHSLDSPPSRDFQL